MRRLLPSIPFALLMVAQVHAAGLPDTGQDQCYDGLGMGACTLLNSGESAIYPRQDGRYGRDAAPAGVIKKIGAGAKGFDYSKIANDGGVLPADAELGINSSAWACTHDNVTGLTWEVKTAGGGDLRYSGHTYTWFNSDDTTNGGDPGGQGSDTCNGNLSGQCNTQAYVVAVNAVNLCGYSDWRLPTVSELTGLVHFGATNPALDTTYFIDGTSSATWAATPDASNNMNAWSVGFGEGLSTTQLKGSDFAVRLVRNGPL